MIEITKSLAIPESELSFAFSRSSGPGGQNVNKVSTRVTLSFDCRNSPSLSPEQKELLYSRLATRISRQGVLRVVSYRHRTQGANREAAVARFVELLQQALHRDKPRRPTKVSKAAKERRLETKKHRGLLKKRRSGGDHG